MNRNILWIHGWGMSSRVWGDVSVLLPSFNHHYIDYNDCDTVESFLETLISQMNGAKPGESWTLIGWSFGGMLALEWLMGHSAAEVAYTLEAVVIVNGTLRFVDANRQLGWPNRVVERMQTQLLRDPKETLQQFALSMFSEADHAKAGYETIVNIVCEEAKQTDFSLSGLDAALTYLRKTDLTIRWQKYRETAHSAKLLWLHGADDPICPVGCMPPLKQEEQRIFFDVGHLPFLTESEPFYEQLRGFLHAE
jgi:pimeloyl-ACP methyl ester carboxylesterase